jgi:hypothetical protein
VAVNCNPTFAAGRIGRVENRNSDYRLGFNSSNTGFSAAIGENRDEEFFDDDEPGSPEAVLTRRMC